jgi:aldose 1-epimerase
VSDGEIHLVVDSMRAAVMPRLGGRLAQLDLGDGPLLRAQAPDLGWSAWGSYPLLPWSNRIPDGRLAIGGRDVRIPANWPDGSAIHGLAASVPWTVVERAEASVVLAVDLHEEPWRVRGSQRFTLEPDRLRHELSVENRGADPVPTGLGIHPWFRAGLVRVPAESKWPGDPLPTGTPVPVDAEDDLRRARVPPLMDRCFTHLTGTSVDVPGVTLSWSGPITQVVVYTGEPGWVAVEPVTMANDGFGLAERGVAGHGVRLLGSGESIGVTYEFARGGTPSR